MAGTNKPADYCAISTFQTDQIQMLKVSMKYQLFDPGLYVS